jgi:hypothetical protein
MDWKASMIASSWFGAERPSHRNLATASLVILNGYNGSCRTLFFVCRFRHGPPATKTSLAGLIPQVVIDELEEPWWRF